MSAGLMIYPDSGYTVAVLANMDPPIAQEVSAHICCRLPATPDRALLPRAYR